MLVAFSNALTARSYVPSRRAFIPILYKRRNSGGSTALRRNLDELNHTAVSASVRQARKMAGNSHGRRSLSESALRKLVRGAIGFTGMVRTRRGSAVRTDSCNGRR